MEIITLYLISLRNEEHYKFNLDVNQLITQYKAEVLGIESKLPAYEAAFNTESQALNVVQGSAITEDICTADANRDETFSGLSGMIKSALSHYESEVAKAANKLKLLFDTFGNVSIKPYDQETAAIINLTDALEGDYAADVATVGLAGWVEELKKRNIAFDTLKNKRYADNSSKPQQSLKVARQNTDNAYHAIVKRINALIEVNGESNYADFVNDLNQRIENYKLVLAQRQGRNAKATADE